MTDSPESFAFLLLCRDLLLASKILATARAKNIALKQVRTAEALIAAGAAAPTLIADLNEPGFLKAAGDWKASHGGRVIGFAGHADAMAFESANRLGIEAMARGAFVAQLDRILT